MRFSHLELAEIWTALQQYVDNRDVTEHGEKDPAPLAAKEALSRIDAYMANLPEEQFDRVIMDIDVLSTSPVLSKRTKVGHVPFAYPVIVLESDHETALVRLPDGVEGVIPARCLESRSHFKICRK
jgi:hypothetical protein